MIPQENNTLIGLFETDNKYVMFRKDSKKVYRDLEYTYSRLMSYLSTNKADYRHQQLSKRANTLMLCYDILLKANIQEAKHIYYSAKSRADEIDKIGKDLPDFFTSYLQPPTAISFEVGLVMYDKCRSFTTALLKGLKRNASTSERYIIMMDGLLNEFKVKNYGI